MNVYSMFDGMSCLQLALKKSEINYEKYYSSEIDKYAIRVTQKNFPETIQLGNANDWKINGLNNIKLMGAGSPCQDLSRIKSKDGKGLDGEKSKLFYQFFNALEYYNPKYFLFENVVMDDFYENIITKLLGVSPILIDSGDFSAQNRPRLYWTNIEFDNNYLKSNLVLKDIIENKVEEKYYYDKPFKVNEGKRVVANMYTHKEDGKRIFTDTTSRVYDINYKAPTLTAVCGGHQEKKILHDGRVRKLTPLEYERLQTVPDGYTDCVSNSQRYKMLGNGWTVDVISHILKGIKKEGM